MLLYSPPLNDVALAVGGLSPRLSPVRNDVTDVAQRPNFDSVPSVF